MTLTTRALHRNGDARPVPFSADTQAPATSLPPGACDCHMHLYNNRYPAAPAARLRPPDASAEDSDAHINMGVGVAKILLEVLEIAPVAA